MSLLIAGSLNHAVNNATIDWGWRRLNATWFETPDGDTAMYVPDSGYALRGLPWGTKVYLGHEWWRRADAQDLKWAFDEGRFIEAKPPKATS